MIFSNHKKKGPKHKTSGSTKLHVKNLEVNLQRKDIRSIRLLLSPEGEIRMSVPESLSDSDAMAFVSSKLPWIYKHLAIIEKKKSLEPDDFSKILFLGKSYTTKTEFHTISPRVFIDEPMIHVVLKPDKSESELRGIIYAWYKSELRKIIPPLIEKWEPVMNVKVSSLQFREMKTRWGTCNTRSHKICFNIELAKKKMPCIEYIVVHEMSHLLFKGHGDDFKACMDKFLPGWRKLRKELRE